MSKQTFPDEQQLRVQRYEDLTATEMVGIIAFHRLANAGQNHEASRALQVSLDLEHFIAVAPLNPADFNQEIVDEITELRQQTQAITGQFVRLNCLHETTGESRGQQKTEMVQALAEALDSGGTTV